MPLVNTLSLPYGLSARALTMGDARSLFELAALQEQHDLGKVEIELADIVADWQRPSFEVGSQTIGVFDGETMVGYGEITGHDRGDAAVHPSYRRRGLGTTIARWMRAAEDDPQAPTLRARLQRMPELLADELRPAQVEAVLARRPNSPGAANLRAALRGEARVTLSPLERRFLKLLTEAGLSLPETNRRAGAHWVDCRWPEKRLTVELDSYRYHHTRHAWEQDRRRERRARARGDEFRRYTWGDVYEDRRFMLAELRALLAKQ